MNGLLFQVSLLTLVLFRDPPVKEYMIDIVFWGIVKAGVLFLFNELPSINSDLIGIINELVTPAS